MSLQNRVDPWGVLHAVPHKGTMMGNRGGRIHVSDKTLGSARWKSKRWICCEKEFRGRKREIWGDSYTELFFLDEVTALASGHRPCFECRNAEARDFLAGEHADDFDRRVHAERVSKSQNWTATLPDGTMVEIDGAAFAVRDRQILHWSFDGYAAAAAMQRATRILTPPSIVAILARGYKPRWHHSAGNLEAT